MAQRDLRADSKPMGSLSRQLSKWTFVLSPESSSSFMNGDFCIEDCPLRSQLPVEESQLHSESQSVTWWKSWVPREAGSKKEMLTGEAEGYPTLCPPPPISPSWLCYQAGSPAGNLENAQGGTVLWEEPYTYVCFWFGELLSSLHLGCPDSEMWMWVR